MRTLAAAVRELYRKDPVEWATLDQSHSPCCKPVATNPICNKRTPSKKNPDLECILVLVLQRTNNLFCSGTMLRTFALTNFALMCGKGAAPGTSLVYVHHNPTSCRLSRHIIGVSSASASCIKYVHHLHTTRRKLRVLQVKNRGRIQVVRIH
jgi:hypothetical protein